MSDSRDRHASTGAGVDNPAELREFASGDNRGITRASEQVSGSSESDSAAASKKLRVRIDPAHPIGDAPRKSDSTGDARDANGDAAAGEFSADGAIEAASVLLPDFDASPEVFSVEKLQQLRLQFEQLAGHLRSQQYQLDRREAQLHSQLAQQENEVRTSRLWFRERQQELADRNAELDRRQLQAETAQTVRLVEREAELLSASKRWNCNARH